VPLAEEWSAGRLYTRWGTVYALEKFGECPPLWGWSLQVQADELGPRGEGHLGQDSTLWLSKVRSDSTSSWAIARLDIACAINVALPGAGRPDRAAPGAPAPVRRGRARVRRRGRRARTQRSRRVPGGCRGRRGDPARRRVHLQGVQGEAEPAPGQRERGHPRCATPGSRSSGSTRPCPRTALWSWPPPTATVSAARRRASARGSGRLSGTAVATTDRSRPGGLQPGRYA
jgi:hypothetical protein